VEDEELREAQEELARLRQLCDSPGWQWYLEVVQAQVTNRINDLILGEPQGLDDMVKRAYAMGECAGIKTLPEIPSMRMEELREAIEMELEERKDAGTSKKD